MSFKLTWRRNQILHKFSLLSDYHWKKNLAYIYKNQLINTYTEDMSIMKDEAMT